MTIADWLFEAMRKLGDAEVDSPRRDTFVFVEDVLEKERTWVNAHGEHVLTDQQVAKLDECIKRRVKREPLAYIRGKAWFYGRFFKVTKDVMIPRPESEAMITLLHDLVQSSKFKVQSVADIGTGSGCLAISAKLEMPNLEVIATDLSTTALKVARENALKHNVEIKFLQGSLLSPLSAANCKLSAVLANLPYVPDGMITSPEITREPSEALFSGKDGLDHYREFWQQISNLSFKPDYVLVESLENQHDVLVSLAQKAGYQHHKTDVLVQSFKNTA